MKFFLIFLFGLVQFNFQSFSFLKAEKEQLSKVASVTDSLPELNKKIIEFVKTKINKKVGRGECWDLAAEALNYAHANWDKDYKFGKEVNFEKETIFAGDIIQFEGVKIQYEKKGVFYSEQLSHHTAIIYTVKKKDDYILAEQNTSLLGKKVGFSALDLKNIVKGKFKIFRPSN